MMFFQAPLFSSLKVKGIISDFNGTYIADQVHGYEVYFIIIIDEGLI